MLAKETTKLTFLEPLLQWGIASFFFFLRECRLPALTLHPTALQSRSAVVQSLSPQRHRHLGKVRRASLDLVET